MHLAALRVVARWFVILSFPTWGAVFFVAPFLPFEAEHRAYAAAGLWGSSEVMFYGGALLLGREAAEAILARLSPTGGWAAWARRLRGLETGPSAEIDERTP